MELRAASGLRAVAFLLAMELALQQTSRVVDSPVSPIVLASEAQDTLCRLSQGIAYFSGGLLKVTILSSGQDISLPVKGSIKKIDCNEDVIAIHSFDPQTSKNRLYIHDTNSAFVRQNYLFWPTSDAAVYGSKQNTGIVIVPPRDTAGELVVSFNARTDSIITPQSTFNLGLQIMSNSLVGATLHSSPRFVLATNNPAMPALVIGFRDPSGPVLEGEITTFPTGIKQILPSMSSSDQDSTSDTLYLIGPNSIKKYLLVQPLSASIIDPQSAVYDSGSQVIRTSKIVDYQKNSFILALLDSGRVILLDKDLTQINYFEEAVLIKAKTFEVELLEDKTLKMAFSIIDELNSANYQIVSYTFNTCALKCSSCFSSSACYGSCQQNYFFLKTSPESLYGSCLESSEIPNGYGIDSNGDGVLKSCLDPGCADCSDDYTGCLSCKTSDTGGNPIALYFNPDATGIKCLASIPVGFGKDLAASPSLTVKRCAVASCAVCDADHLHCSRCVAPLLALNSQESPSRCMLEENLPDGWGVSTINRLIAALCQDPDCEKCQTSVTSCSKCSEASRKWLKIDSLTTTCASPDARIDFFGKNLESSTLEPCLDAGCRDCFDDRTTCVTCRSTSTISGLELYRGFISNTAVCRTIAQLPKGLFLDTGSKTFTTCQVLRCQDCSSDVTQCIECAKDFYVYATGGQTSCLSVAEVKLLPEIDRKVGKNGLIFSPCASNCLECFDDHLSCTKCEAGYSILAGAQRFSCLSNQLIPSGWGTNSKTGIIETCKDLLCDDCRVDSSLCVTCLASAYFYVSDEASLPPKVACFATSSIPSGWGKDPQSGQRQLKRCTFQNQIDTQCMDCSQHFGKCRQCADSFFIQPISSTPFTHCVDGTGIEVGYGKDLGTPASQLLMPCTAASCSDCAADRQICRRCQAGLFLDDQILASSGFPSCQSISSVVTDPAYSKAGISNSSMAIRECRADCLKCTYDAAGCENCDLGKYLLKEGSNFFCEELIYLESHEGYGVDLTQPAIKKIRRCSDPNCKVCKGDFSDCTECQTTYYLYADPKVNMKSVCVGPSQATFFPFTGIATGATPPRVGPCSIQNCAAQGCRSDNAYCSSCKQNFVIQILSPNENACIQDSPVVPIGYGKDISDSTIKPCLLKASNCALCPQDYRVCEQCQNGYLMNTTDTSSPNSLCLLPNQEYPGLGIDLANTLLLRPCQDSNCEQCPSDFSKCESCKVGFLVDKISIPIRSWCRSELDFVEFVGKNGQLIALCKDLGCSNCFLDFQTCLECGTGLTLNTESIQNLPKCLPIEDLPIGYGADSNKKLIPCIDPLCRTCHDAATCSICSENAYLGLQGKCELCRPECKTCSIGDSCLSCNDGYYLMKNSAPHQMNCINGPPSGFGIDSRDRSIMPCSDSNCEICLSDFESCSVCKGVFKLLIDTQSLKGRCIDTQTALNGYGWHSISSTYRKCEVQNCYWCWDDNSICSTCLDPQSPTFYTLSIGQTTTCVGESDIPSKYGIDWTDKTVKPCSTSHCLFCSSDYSNCTKCEDGYSLLIDSDGTHRCISSGLDGFGTDPGTSLTVACSDLRCKGCQQNFQQCSACYAGYLTTWPPAQLSIPCLTLGSSLKEGPDPAALNTTTFATTPRLLPCFDSLYCDDCSLSYLLCQKCKAGTFHYRVDPPLLRAESPFASYYLGAEFYRCLSPSATWPLAYGEDIENQKKELKPCSSGCSSCSSNYKVCQQCPVTFFVAVDGRCISPDMLSSIEGQGIARWNSNFTIKSQTLSLCDDSNCLNCTNWNSNCVRCKASYNLDQQNGACKSNAALKDSGLGPNLQTSELIIVPCQDQRCFNCNQDHTKCTSCKLQYLYFTDETYQTVTCYLKDELITHKKNLGPLNVNSQQLVLCESKCKTCPSIYNKCSSCLDDEAFLTPEQDCVPYSQLQRDLSNGLDIVTRSKLPCQAALCKDCWANYLLCTSCSADTSLVLEKATTVSACYSQTNIPAGKGASIVEEIQFIEKCRLEGCSRCAEDSSICLECDSGRYQELDVTSRVNVCHKTMDSVSAPFGKNGNSFILKPCAAGCLNCKDDYRLCSTCKEGWYLFQGKCFPESNVPPKTFGKDRQASFYRYLPCLSELNCKECYDNFRVCDVCLDGYGFDIKKTCVPISVNTPGYGSNGTAVVPCDVKNCARCSSYYKICTECKKGYLSQAKSDGSTACIAAVENPRGYGIVGTTSIPCQVQHCEVCTYNSYGCEYCSNHYFVLSNGNKTLCVLREDIPRGYGVKDFQAVPCTEQNCLDCTLNNKNCLECRAGFYPSLEDSDQICLSNERTVQKKALEAAALNEGLQKYQNDINSGLLLLKFVVDVSEINNKNLIYNAFDSTSGKRLGDLKVTNFELGSDNHTISFSLDLPEPTRPFDLLIQTNRSIFALKSRKRLLSRSLQLQKQEASSSDPFSKGVLISDIQFTRPGLTWIKVSGLIMSISMMVAAAASFLRDSTYCYRLVELSIMIGMFSVWSCPKPLAFSQFIYWFRYSLFGIIPFVEVNEDFVRCVGDGPLAFQGYSCFIYNNTRTFIPSFFAWLLLLLIIGRLSASSLLKKVGNLSTKIELETKKPDKSGPILTTHMLKFWLSLALPVSYFAFINLYYMNESTAMKFGFFLSLLAIFFYAATLLLGFISVAKLTEDQEKLTSIIHLTFLLGLEIHPESKPQLKYARLYEILRNFLLGAVLALLNTSPLAQSIAAFVTLLVYLPFLIYFSPYKAADLTRFYITKEIFALYLSLCLLISASSRLSVDSLQQGVGAATCIGVLILLIASFFLVLYPFCAKRSSSRTFNN